MFRRERGAEISRPAAHWARTFSGRWPTSTLKFDICTSPMPTSPASIRESTPFRCASALGNFSDHAESDFRVGAAAGTLKLAPEGEERGPQQEQERYGVVPLESFT